MEVVHPAFARLTDMQGQVVGILDALLSTPLAEADVAIDKALARMGELTGTDRVYVFRLRPTGDYVDNTHEWCAPGIASMRFRLLDIPAATVAGWHSAFLAGEDVLISDVAALPDMAPEKQVLLEQGIRSLAAVPMIQDGILHGFFGHDAVRDLRTFLPGEVHLIRAVAKVVHAVLSRRDAEAGLVAAHAETTEQRTRLEAVLGAMPDLIVELDRDGRFVTWHSGTIVVPEAVGAAVGALQDGFVLYDAQDRLVICNDRYREIYANSAPDIVPGATFESILRYGLARGEYASGIGREEDWLAERLARHRDSDSEIEQQLSDGRWLRIFEKAKPAGARLACGWTSPR